MDRAILLDIQQASLLKDLEAPNIIKEFDLRMNGVSDVPVVINLMGDTANRDSARIFDTEKQLVNFMEKVGELSPKLKQIVCGVQCFPFSFHCFVAALFVF